MAQTTYQVALSSDGKHQVTVTTDNQSEAKLALAWAKATLEQLVAHYGSSGKAAEGELNEDNPPECGVHHIPMVRVQGKKGPFWSCHEKNDDGSRCSYKPV
jgi:hypothetical protein